MPKRPPPPEVPSIAEGLALITDIDIKNALSNLRAAFGIDEKQLIKDDEDKPFGQLQAENLILWLKETFDRHDDGTRAEKIKDRLNAMNNRLIEHYSGHATLDKDLDEKAVPVNARQQLIQAKLNLLAHACVNFRMVAITPLLESIHQQLVLVARPKNVRVPSINKGDLPVNDQVLNMPQVYINRAVVIESYKNDVITNYRKLLAQLEEQQKQPADVKIIISLLKAELQKLDPIGPAILQVPGVLFPPTNPKPSAASTATAPAVAAPTAVASKYLPGPPTATL